MLHSDCILLGDHSIPWDTGCARRLLLVTDEERRILDNIPGWSVVEIEKSDKHISEGETSPLVVERPLTQLHIPVARSDIAEAGSDIAEARSDIAEVGSDIAEARSDIAEVGSDIADAGSDIADVGSTDTYNTPNPNSDNVAKVSARNCDSPWKENLTITLSNEKHSFMQSISLYANKVVDIFSSIPRKRSNSLSDMYLAKLDDGLPFSKSETSLNGDLYSHQTSKTVKNVTCEKLDTRILNHPFMKDTLPSTEGEYDNLFLLHKAMEDTANRKELLKKRLELLEKRFSPSGENGLLWPSEGIATSKFNLGSISNQNLTYTNVCLPNLVCDNLINSYNAVLDGTNSPLSVCPYSSEKMNKLNTIIVENQKLLMSIAKSAEKVSEAEPSFPSNDFCCGEKGAKPTNNVLSTVHNEESLPLTTRAPSPEKATKPQKEQISVVVQPTQTKEAVNLNPLIECCVSQNCGMPDVESGVSESCDITAVESCALQPYETPSSLNTPCIQSNSINQITNSEMHPKNDDYCSKTIVADTENAHSNVFSENCTGHDVVKNSASGKLGGKRKRQNKDVSKPRKKSSLTNSLVCIQYTADQVRNMIQIMKFQSEMHF